LLRRIDTLRHRVDAVFAAGLIKRNTASPLAV
jgi:hypothetical protein